MLSPHITHLILPQSTCACMKRQSLTIFNPSLALLPRACFHWNPFKPAEGLKFDHLCQSSLSLSRARKIDLACTDSFWKALLQNTESSQKNGSLWHCFSSFRQEGNTTIHRKTTSHQHRDSNEFAGASRLDPWIKTHFIHEKLRRGSCSTGRGLWQKVENIAPRVES